jgi:streptogramin lyase
MKYLKYMIPGLVLVTPAFAGEKPANKKTPAPAAPKTGIKTPGIQIPFSRLKAEAEFQAPDKPAWIFVTSGPAGVAFIPAKNSIDRIDLKTNKKNDALTALDQPCGGMVSAFNSLWAPVCGAHSLARLDAKTFKPVATIKAGTAAAPGAIAASTDSIWMLTDDKTTLSRIDPDQNTVAGETRVPSGCRSLVLAENALWLACPSQDKVLRVNPRSNLVDQSIKVSAEPISVAAGSGSIWVLCRKDGKIDRIDPKTNKVSKTIDLEVPGADGELAFGDNFLWATQTGFPLTRIDPTTEKEAVMQQFSGEGGGAIFTSPGAIWLSNVKAGTVWRIDPKLVIATIPE